MIKKLSIVLGVLLVTIMPICYAYTDIDNHWSKSSVESLSKIDIIKGYEDGSFRPDECITRAEFVTIINRLLQNSHESNKYTLDNNSKDWYYSEIKKAIASGIIKGDPDGKVRPNDLITKEEEVVVLYRAFSNKETDSVKVFNYFDSDSISKWAQDALAIFVKDGYVKGYEDNTIRPKSNITRAETATLLDRFFAEIVVRGKYSGDVYGNLLVNGADVKLENTMIDGDLIITEGISDKTVIRNIIVNGDLILRSPIHIPSNNFVVKGSIIELYSKYEDLGLNVYKNDTYGIEFTLPKKARVVEIDKESKHIKYNSKNLIVISYECDDKTIYKSFNSAEENILNNYANIFERLLYKKQETVETGYYYDKKANVHLILIKRDEVIYTIMIYNAENDNIADSLLNSIKLYDCEKVKKHEIKNYKNKNLFLEFSYIDYVGVDDSYNTNVVYEGDAEFILFVQVTTITDMKNYTIDELKYMFDSITNEEGKVLDSKIKKVYKYNAVDYTIDLGNKLSRTLYVVADTKLYKFILTGDKDKIESIGNDIFENITSSIEM